MSESTQTSENAVPAELFRLLPSVNEILLSPPFESLMQRYDHDAIVRVVRVVLDRLRTDISAGQCAERDVVQRVADLAETVAAKLSKRTQYSLRRVINATGVLLHTNLGRAPLSQSALDHIVEVAQGYSNLEFDLETGERSRRDLHAESLVLQVLDAKGAFREEKDAAGFGVVIVNNCAAATFLALNTLAERREVVISRGELIEIGGGFRIPEILEKSGAILKEVGTTNRTKVQDYEYAISANTALILRVHQSNFSMEGFIERPALTDLVAVGKIHSIPVFEDQGTGLLTSLVQFGVGGESTLPGSLEAGVDLVAASGDKLLGGPQCGILVGRLDHIQRIRRNPLLRTFRVDKLTYAALEATLIDHLTESEQRIPLMRMLSSPPEEVFARCMTLLSQITSKEYELEAIPVMSLIGGGTAPGARLSSFALSLRHTTLTASALLGALRKLDPPIIGRVSDDRVMLDLRTVEPEFDSRLAVLLSKVLWSS